jgi:hypothetical protein
MFYGGRRSGDAPRLNCWEHHKCGREPGGKNVDSAGVCPAAVASAYDGVHGGTCAGRACWVVAGTMCGGVVQGTFAQKYQNCEACSFYQRVCLEEGPALVLSAFLLQREDSP